MIEFQYLLTPGGCPIYHIQVSILGQGFRGLAFPLNAVVNQNSAKAALLLAAVEPSLGILISGGHAKGVIIYAAPELQAGTGKSVMARGLHALLVTSSLQGPTIIGEEPSEDIQSTTNSYSLPVSKSSLGCPPFVTVPLGVTEDRVLGTIDVQQSIEKGRAVFMPGLLAQSHGGILYIDDLHLLEEGICNLMMEAVSSGINVVEREGLSFSHMCKPTLLATFNPDEGEIRKHVLDRFAIVVEVSNTLTCEDRCKAVLQVLKFQESQSSFWISTRESFEEIMLKIKVAKELLLNEAVHMTSKQVQYLVEEAVRAGVEGHRAEIYATKAAMASAALASRTTVTSDDLKLAVELCIVPRSGGLVDYPTPSAAHQQQQGGGNEVEDTDSTRESRNSIEEHEEIPNEFIFSPEGVLLDARLLDLARRCQPRGRSGKQRKSVIYSQDRGRYVKPIFPKGELHRLAIDATLRAAAPWQKSRRHRRFMASSLHGDVYDTLFTPHVLQEDKRNTIDTKKLIVFIALLRVIIHKDDIRIKKLCRKASKLIIFLVDASGSMAFNRMAAAKGAALTILAESYRSRNQVAIVPFFGTSAPCLVPPTRSLAFARKRLEAMPCGGGTPLAQGLVSAMQVANTARKRRDVGQAFIVLITDGRANVPLSLCTSQGAQSQQLVVELGKEDIEQEALSVARLLPAADLGLLVIDTENQFMARGLGVNVAKAANGAYYRLPTITTTIDGATKLAPLLQRISVE